MAGEALESLTATKRAEEDVAQNNVREVAQSADHFEPSAGPRS